MYMAVGTSLMWSDFLHLFFNIYFNWFFWRVGWELLFTEKIIYSSVVSLVSRHIMKPAQIIFVISHSMNIFSSFHLIFLDLMFFH